MKGFLEWFKASTKMKRWIFLILIGIVLTCYGISQILVMKELSFFDVGKIVVSFAVGFTAIIIGIVFTQKRTLELLVQDSDERLEGESRNAVKSLIFNKKVYDKGPNIVVIGGGSGLNTVLKGLKAYTSNITAIVTVSSYGTAPSDSRKELAMLPLDDIKESMVALASDETAMEGLMNLKFEDGKLRKLSFGDIYLSAMEHLYGNFTDSIEKSRNVLNIIGRVLPVTLEEINIAAELQDGSVVTEKSKIPEMVLDKVSKINRIYITPTNCKPAPGVIEAIEKADAIIIGPGSLYTNVIPNLLVKGVSKAIKESKAMKVYISNIMTEPGQTDNYSLSDHMKAIIDHAGKGIIDYCIYDTGEVIPEFIKRYNKQGADLVEQDIAKAKALDVKLLQRDLASVNGEYIRHNPEAVAASIIELICDDLKFNDKQNAPQYLMLNSRLMGEKKKLKKNQKAKQKVKRVNANAEGKEKAKKQSKFGMKYQERIETIRQTDLKIRENQRLAKKNEALDKAYENRKVKSEPVSGKSTGKNGKHIKKAKVEQKNRKIEKPKQRVENQLEEEEKKKFLDTINKLRK